MTRRELGLRWVLSSLPIGAGLAWLHLIGVGELAAPSWSIDGVRTWLDHTDTTLAAFVMVRVLAIALGWYLLVVITLGCASRWLGLPRVTSFVDRITVPFARGVLGGVATLGLTLTASPASAVTPADEQVTLHLVQSAPPEPAPSTAAAPAPARRDDSVWTVEPGDSLWSIATARLREIRGDEITDQQIDTYWRQVIELNRPRLVNPADPNLLFSGQLLELPDLG